MSKQHPRYLRPGAVPNLIPLSLEPIPHFINHVVDFGIVPGILQLHSHGYRDGGKEQNGQGGNETYAPKDGGVDQLLVAVLQFGKDDVIDAVVVVVVIVSFSGVEGVEDVVILVPARAAAVVVVVVIIVIIVPVVVVIVAATAAAAVPVSIIIIIIGIGLILLVVVRAKINNVPSRSDRRKHRGHKQPQKGGPDVGSVRIENVSRQRVDAELERRPRIVRHGQAVRLGFVEAGGFVEEGDGGMAGEAAQLAAD